MLKTEREAVLKALNEAETKPTAEMDELFTMFMTRSRNS